MRPIFIAIIAFSFLAQPAAGWQRWVCSDGSACPIPVEITAFDAAICCPPNPCEPLPLAPLKHCRLSEAPDYAPAAANRGEIHKPVFLSIAPVTADVLPQQTRFTEAHDAPPLRSALPIRQHAARAPPLAA